MASLSSLRVFVVCAASLFHCGPVWDNMQVHFLLRFVCSFVRVRGGVLCVARAMPDSVHPSTSTVRMLESVEEMDDAALAADALAAIDRMEGTVNDVLDFRKLDANLFSMSPKPVDVSQLLQDACHNCRSFLAPHVALRYRVVTGGSVESPTGLVMLDARRVHQIVTNGLR
jgi:signal transduction histidine kinase